MRNKIIMFILCLSIVMGSLGEITYAACSADAVKGNIRKVNVNSFSVDETVVDEDASTEEESDSAHDSSDKDADSQGDYPESGMEDDDSEENESSYGDTEQHSEIEADEDVSESTENDDSTSEIADEDPLEEPQGDVELGNEDKDLNDNSQSGDSDSDSADTSGSNTEETTIDDYEERTGDPTAEYNAAAIDAENEFTEKEELCNDASGNSTYTVSENEATTTEEDYDIYTFDANGGYFFSGETVYEEKVKPGKKAYGATPKIDDEMKIFGGWSRKKDATTPEFENYWDACWPNEPCYVYAVWVDACTITLDANGGYYYDRPTYDEVTERQIKVKKNTLLERIEEPIAPDSEKIMIFGGWSLKENGEIEDEIYPTDGMTLYAIWVTPYRITFSPNGGYYWPDNTASRTHNLVPGKKIGLIDHPILNETLQPLNHDENKILLGWKIENKGSLITDIKEYIPDGDCTFYAVWSNDEIKITSIEIDQNNLSVDKGWTQQISAHIEPDDATNKTITWVSSDENVAKVDKNGKVTGVGAGTVTISATALDGSGVTAECKVTVIEKTMAMSDVSAAAYNKLNVSWEKCEGADGYMVYRKGNGEAYTLVKSLSGEDSTSFTNSVVSGAKYTYKVSAYKMDGMKKVILAQTGEMSGTALPEAPVMKSTGMAAFNKIKVIWTKVSGCAGYVIYRSTEEDGQYTVLKTVTMATATEYSNIVQDGQTYYYKIRAFVEVNGKKVYGDYSEVLSGDVIDAPPANFRLEQRTATKIVFSWDKVEDAEGYVIYRYFPDTSKCKAIKNITSKDTLTYSYKVDADTDYQFTMRAFREVNGKKVYSEYTEITSN